MTWVIPNEMYKCHPFLYRPANFAFPGGSEVKASACSAGDPGSIPEPGRYPGE